MSQRQASQRLLRDLVSYQLLIRLLLAFAMILKFILLSLLIKAARVSLNLC